jgi:23S rRNA (uracil1939-C5)-methyltransferase
MSAVMDLTIDSIAAGGDGVARREGLVVFVPRSAPGDRLRARVAAKRSFGRGIIEELLVPGDARIDPPCPHYTHDRCGGCQIQHLRYDAQLAAKSEIIGDGLRRIGKRLVVSPPVRASEKQWRYRSKLTLAMRRRGDRWVIGLHPYDDPIGVFQLNDCPITDERVVAVWREIMRAADHLPDVASLRGAVRLLSDGGASFVLEGATRWPAWEAFAAAVPSVTSLWWQPEERDRRLLLSRRDAGDSASFTQINPTVAAELHAFVVDRAATTNASHVVDAYAGSGATAVPLAQRGCRVTAIELDADAAWECGRRLPSGSTSLSGRVELLLPRALPADLVLLNPPRTGLHEDVPALLQAAPDAPQRLIYVSCNPATLGRDLARMPRYTIRHVEAFDMFPQTAHVETVCELERLEAAA